MSEASNPESHAQHSPFWRFSLKLYGMPGVPSACLFLQDQSGVDVNVLLFGLFLAGQGRSVSAADFAVMAEATEAWRRHAVVPIRTARRFLKEPPEAFVTAAVAALRERVKGIELEAERLQQEALYALRPVSGWGEPAVALQAAKANTSAYEGYLAAWFDQRSLETLRSAFARMPGGSA